MNQLPASASPMRAPFYRRLLERRRTRRAVVHIEPPLHDSVVVSTLAVSASCAAFGCGTSRHAERRSPSSHLNPGAVSLLSGRVCACLSFFFGLVGVGVVVEVVERVSQSAEGLAGGVEVAERLTEGGASPQAAHLFQTGRWVREHPALALPGAIFVDDDAVASEGPPA